MDIVAKSIDKYGFKQPIVVDKNNVVVVGHTRLKAAKKLGLKEVPVIVADDLTDEEINEYRLVDNKSNEFAEWDFNKLAFELENIELDMNDFGFESVTLNIDDFSDEFTLPDSDTPANRTITLTLSEGQYEIAQSVIDYFKNNDEELHTFGNENKKSNYLFEAVYQWAELKKL